MAKNIFDYIDENQTIDVEPVNQEQPEIKVEKVSQPDDKNIFDMLEKAESSKKKKPKDSYKSELLKYVNKDPDETIRNIYKLGENILKGVYTGTGNAVEIGAKGFQTASLAKIGGKEARIRGLEDSRKASELTTEEAEQAVRDSYSRARIFQDVPEEQMEKQIQEGTKNLLKSEDKLVFRNENGEYEVISSTPETMAEKKMLKEKAILSEDVELFTEGWTTLSHFVKLAEIIEDVGDIAVPDEWEKEVQKISSKPITFERFGEDPTGTIETLLVGASQQIPIIASAMGATTAGTVLTGSPLGGYAAGVAAMSALEAGWYMEQVEQIGKQYFKNEKEYQEWRRFAARNALKHGVGSGLVEYLGNVFGAAGQTFKQTFRTLKSQIAKSSAAKTALMRLVGAGGESIEEGLQAMSSNYWFEKSLEQYYEATGNKTAKELLESDVWKEDIGESAKRGGLYSAVLAGGGGSINTTIRKMQQAKQLGVKLEMSKSDARAYIDISNKLTKKLKVVEEAVYNKDATEQVKETKKFIENNEEKIKKYLGKDAYSSILEEIDINSKINEATNELESDEKSQVRKLRAEENELREKRNEYIRSVDKNRARQVETEIQQVRRKINDIGGEDLLRVHTIKNNISDINKIVGFIKAEENPAKKRAYTDYLIQRISQLDMYDEELAGRVWERTRGAILEGKLETSFSLPDVELETKQKKAIVKKDIQQLTKLVDNGENIEQGLQAFENKKEDIKEVFSEKEFGQIEEAINELQEMNEQNKEPVAKIEKVEEEKETPVGTQNKIIKNSNMIIDAWVEKLEQGEDITPQLKSFKNDLEKLNIDESKKEQLRGRVSELEQRIDDIGEEAKQLMKEKSILTGEVRDITDPEVIDEYKQEIQDLDEQIKEIRKKNAREVELEQEIEKVNKVIESTKSETFKQKQTEKVEKLKKELAELQEKELEEEAVEREQEVVEEEQIPEQEQVSTEVSEREVAEEGREVAGEQVIEEEGKGIAEEEVAPETAEMEAEQPTTPEGEVIEEQEIKKSERVNVYDVPLNKIQTDVDKFQNRSSEYSEESVNRIVKAVKENNFKWEDFDPVLLWEDNNNQYVIAGHSRLEAFNRLASEGYEDFNEIPAKIYRGTKEEAIRSAEVSNVLASPEYLIDRTKLYRNKLNKDDANRKKIFEEIRDYHADNWRKIVEYAHLNPDGIVMDALRRTQKATDKSAAMDIKKIAQWIGAAKWEYRDKLTDAHEKEMFDFLKDTKKMNKIGTKKLFTQKIGHIVRNAFFNPADELNLKGLERVGESTKKYQRQMAEYKTELDKQEDNILKWNSKLADAKEKDNTDEIIRIQDKIDDINKVVKQINRDIINLKMKKGNVTREDLGQQNLIDLLENFKQYGVEDVEFDSMNNEHWDLKDKLDDKLYQKDIKGLLEDIVETSEVPLHVERANRFLNIIDEINNIKINHKYRYEAGGWVKTEEMIGQFDPYNNSINFSTLEMTAFMFGLQELNKGETFDEMFNQIVLHEIGHAVATYKLMQYDINNKKGGTKFKNLNIKAEPLKGNVLRATEEINNLYEYVKGELEGEVWRGLDNVSEFVTESVANTQFRERLRNLEVPNNISTQNNIISAIKDFVDKLLVALGLKQKADVVTKAEQIMNDMINNYSYIKAESMRRNLANAVDEYFGDYYITDEIKRISKEVDNVSPQRVLFADENAPTQNKAGESLRVTQKNLDAVKNDVVSLYDEKWNITDIVEDGSVQLENIETGEKILVDIDNFDFDGVEQKQTYDFPSKKEIKKLVRYHQNDIVEYDGKQYFVTETTNDNKVNLKDQQGNVVESVNKNALELLERSSEGKRQQSLIDQIEIRHGIDGNMVDMVRDMKRYPSYESFLQGYIIEQEGWRNIPTQYLNERGEQVNIAQSGEQFTQQVENRQAQGEEWGKVYSNYLLEMNQNSDVNTLEELFEEVTQLKNEVVENNTSFREAKENVLRSLTSKEKNKLRKLYNRVFGKNYHKFEDVVKLVDMIEGNRMANGAYKDGLIEIVKGEGAEESLAHEIIHKILDVALSDAQRNTLLNKVTNKIEQQELIDYGINQDGIDIGNNFTDFKKKNGKMMTSDEYIDYKKNLRNTLTEEKLSEDFVEIAKSPDSFTGYIKNMYKKILNAIKKLLGRWGEVENFYDDVLSGKFAENGIETYKDSADLSEVKYREKPSNDLQRRLNDYKNEIDRLQNEQDSNAELTESERIALKHHKGTSSTKQQKKIIHMLANKLGYNSSKNEDAYRELMTIVSEKPSTLAMNIFEAQKAIRMLDHLIDFDNGKVERSDFENPEHPTNKEINTEEAYQEHINSINRTNNKLEDSGIKEENNWQEEVDELWEERVREDEQRVKQLSEQDKKWKIPAWVKEYYDFVDLGFWLATKTGDMRIALNAKTIESGRNVKKDKYAKHRVLLHKKHGNVLQKLHNDEAYFKDANKKLIDYFLNNKEIKGKELSALAKDLEKIMQWSTQVVRYKRPEMYFYGRLNKGVFAPEQQAVLDKWGKTLGNFEDNRLKYQSLFNLIQRNGNPDTADMQKYLETTGLTEDQLMEMYDESKIFVRKDYLPEDKDVMAKFLPEDDLHKNKKEALTIGRGHLMSKIKQGLVKESVVEKVLRTYRSTLTQRYVDMPVFRFNKLVKEQLHEKPHADVKRQLRKIMGFGTTESGTARALRNLMGAGYALYVAPRMTIQIKNLFQKMLDTGSAFSPKDFFKGFNKLREDFGEDVVNRFENEMPQKEYIKERAALGLFATNRTKMIKDFKEAIINFTGKNVTVGEYLIDRLGANWAVSFFKRTIGEGTMNIMAGLDRANRANNMYVNLEKCKETLNNENLSWAEVEKKLEMGTLNETERHYLRSIAKFGGLREFAWQYAKMRTLKSQFEYDTALRNLWSNTGKIGVDLVMQYSTWPRGFGKRFWQTTRQLFTKEGDKVAAAKALAGIGAYGYLFAIMIDMMLGKIRGGDDEPYEETVLKHGLRTLSPFDYAGSWNAGTLIPPPLNAYGIYNTVMNRTWYNEVLTFGHITNILIGTGASFGNLAAFGWHKITGNDRQAHKSIKNMSINFDKTLDSSFYPYIFINNLLDVWYSKRDANWIRSVIDKRYRPRDYERNGWEALTHILFNSNAPKSKRFEKINRLLGKNKNEHVFY